MPDYIAAMANRQEYEEFSKRLKNAMSKAGFGVHGATQLAQAFNRAHAGRKITHQGAQKWLDSQSIPTQDKLLTLARLLGVSPAWLRFGEGKETAGVTANDAANGAYCIHISDQELLKRYRKLSDRQQQAVAEIITALAAKDSRR